MQHKFDHVSKYLWVARFHTLMLIFFFENKYCVIFCSIFDVIMISVTDIWLDWFLRRLRVLWVFYMIQSIETRCLSIPIPVLPEFLRRRRPYICASVHAPWGDTENTVNWLLCGNLWEFTKRIFEMYISSNSEETY